MIDMINIYYLLYEIDESNIYWIVTIFLNFYEAKERIKNYYLESDNYYIVKRKVNLNNNINYLTKYKYNKSVNITCQDVIEILDIKRYQNYVFECTDIILYEI
jgi:hypothetical protein